MKKTLSSLLCLAFLVLGSSALAQVPSITAQPTANTTVTVGGSVTLSVTATVTSGTLTYSLFNLRSSTALMGPSSSPSFTFTPTTNNNGDTYFIKAFANGQTTQSQNAIVFVQESTSSPTETAVQNFGTSSAPQFLGSLGFNTDNPHSWHYSAAAYIGATWARPRECGWAGDADSLNLYRQPTDIVSSETMSFTNPAAPTSAGYRLSPSSNCAQALAWAAANNLHVEMTLDYESPYGAIVYATTTADNPAGSTTINLGSITSGSLSNIIPDNSSLIEYNLTQISSHYQASGTLINSFSGTSVTLEAPTTIDIPSGTQMSIFTSLYPPVLVPAQATQTGWYNQAGIQGFLAWADAMGGLCASALASATLSPGYPPCVLDFMNEPEHSNHLWDSGSLLYATPPATLPLNNGGGYVIAIAAMNRTPGAGYLYGNGWTDTVGASRDITSTSMYQYLPTDFSRAWKNFAWQSFHPYGPIPETDFVLPECFKALGYAVQTVNCQPIDKNPTANFPTMYVNMHRPNVFGGIGIAFTETGIGANGCVGETPSLISRARFVARQFLAGVANGYGPYMFYMLSNSSSSSSTVESSTVTACNFDFFDNLALTPTGTINGSNTTFTLPYGSLSYVPAFPLLYHNGTLQTSGFTVSGSTVTFTVPPASGDTLVAQVPLPQAATLAQIMSDVKTMPLTPVAPYSPCQMPQVASYSGYYPLAETFVVGAKAGELSNRIMMSVWSMTYPVPPNGSPFTVIGSGSSNWDLVASPTPVSTSFRIPSNLTVTAATDTITLTPVAFTLSGQTLTLPVADDQIDILLAPPSTATQPVTGCT